MLHLFSFLIQGLKKYKVEKPERGKTLKTVGQSDGEYGELREEDME